MPKVVFFNREPRKTGYSIEGIFSLVKDYLQDRISYQDYYFDPSKSRLQNILSIRKYRNSINHITGDVYFLALGLKGSKNILTIHDIGHYDTLKKVSAIKALLYRIIWLYLPLKKADVITVVSNFTKEQLIAAFPFTENKIRVIYNPVKPVFKFSEAKNICGLPRILQIGTGKHKNLDNLIEAVKGDNYHLDIIGWPDQEQLKKIKDHKISYSLYNSLSDEELFERYKACDILFFASHYEGFGMPIIEAQAVGRPVITSNYGAMKEVVIDSAILVNPSNPREIKSAISNLVNDKQLYQQLVTKGQHNVKKFSAEVISNEYFKLYSLVHEMKID